MSNELYKYANELGLTIKKVAVFKGREGYAKSANVYHNGELFATFLDEGNGGAPYILGIGDSMEQVSASYKIIRELSAKALEYPDYKVMTDTVPEGYIMYRTDLSEIIESLVDVDAIKLIKKSNK